MSEWLTYRAEDFLLFSPRVYWRMFELHNNAFWPLHLLTLASGVVILLMILRQPRGHGPMVGLILGALWAFVAWAFLWQRYAAINWAMTYVAPAFALEALTLVIASAGGRLAFDDRDIAAWIGLLLVGFGLVLYWLLPLFFERPWASAEVFGIAPEPTVIVTLGVLLAARGRFMLLLLPVPLVWLLLSGLTLRTMGDQQSWIPFLAAGAAVAALALRLLNRR